MHASLQGYRCRAWDLFSEALGYLIHWSVGSSQGCLLPVRWMTIGESGVLKIGAVAQHHFEAINKVSHRAHLTATPGDDRINAHDESVDAHDCACGKAPALEGIAIGRPKTMACAVAPPVDSNLANQAGQCRTQRRINGPRTATMTEDRLPPRDSVPVTETESPRGAAWSRCEAINASSSSPPIHPPPP